MKSNHQNSKSRKTARLTGVLLFILFLLIIGASAFFLWQKLFYREEIARFLPAEQTLAFAEINLDQNSPELQQLFKLSSANPYLNQQSFQNLLDNIPPQSKDFQKWFAGRLGAALIAQPHQNPAPILLLKIKDNDKMLDWLNNNFFQGNRSQLIQQDYFGQKMISFQTGQNYRLLISGNYLIISESQNALELIAQTTQNQNLSLKNHPDYNQIYSSLPQQNLAFIYYDTTKILASLSENPSFLDVHLATFQQFLPFLKIFSREAIAIYTDKDSNGKISLNAQQLSLFNKSILPTADFFNIKYFYNGALEKLLPQNTIATIGGTNLADQKNKIEAVFANQSTVQSLLFSGTLEKFKDTVFTPSAADQTNVTNKIDLNQDFFAILQSNYLFSVQTGTPGHLDFSLLIENKNAQNDQIKIQKLLLALAKNAASKTQTQTIEVTLPDGTKGQNIVGTSIEPQVTTEDVNGVTVQSIAISDSLNIYSVAVDEKIFVSTNVTALLDMISKDKQKEPDQENPQLMPKLDHLTEYYSFDLNALSTAINLPQLQTYFLPLQQLKIGRKFTQIGVLSIYSFEQK